MRFKVVLNPGVVSDIQKAVDYYDAQQVGIGAIFEKAIEKHIIHLSTDPFYQIRYHSVRCLPIKKFPFMIHYIVDESSLIVRIIAIFHTSINPENWKEPS